MSFVTVSVVELTSKVVAVAEEVAVLTVQHQVVVVRHLARDIHRPADVVVTRGAADTSGGRDVIAMLNRLVEIKILVQNSRRLKVRHSREIVARYFQSWMRLVVPFMMQYKASIRVFQVRDLGAVEPGQIADDVVLFEASIFPIICHHRHEQQH